MSARPSVSSFRAEWAIVLRWGLQTAAAAACMWAAGCLGPVLPTVRTRQLCERLSRAESFESAQDIIQQIVSSDDPGRYDTLLSEWGGDVTRYDLYVLDALKEPGREHRPRLHGWWPAMVRRIGEKPDVVRQIFWYARWSRNEWYERALQRASAEERPYLVWVAERCRSRGAEHLSVDSKCWYLLQFASMLDRPDWLINTSEPEELLRRWEDVIDWLAVNAPYCEYDARSGLFRLNETRRDEGCPVTEDEQRWLPASTPLPVIRSSSSDRIQKREREKGTGVVSRDIRSDGTICDSAYGSINNAHCPDL